VKSYERELFNAMRDTPTSSPHWKTKVAFVPSLADMLAGELSSKSEDMAMVLVQKIMIKGAPFHCVGQWVVPSSPAVAMIETLLEHMKIPGLSADSLADLSGLMKDRTFECVFQPIASISIDWTIAIFDSHRGSKIEGIIRRWASELGLKVFMKEDTT